MPTTAKSALRAEHGRRVMASLPRDPKTGRLLKKTPAAHPAADPPEPAPVPEPSSTPPAAGGGAPASDPFRGRIMRRWRKRSS